MKKNYLGAQTTPSLFRPIYSLSSSSSSRCYTAILYLHPFPPCKQLLTVVEGPVVVAIVVLLVYNTART